MRPRSTRGKKWGLAQGRQDGRIISWSSISPTATEVEPGRASSSRIPARTGRRPPQRPREGRGAQGDKGEAEIVSDLRCTSGCWYRWEDADVRYALRRLSSGRVRDVAPVLRPAGYRTCFLPPSDPGPLFARVISAVRGRRQSRRQNHQPRPSAEDKTPAAGSAHSAEDKTPTASPAPSAEDKTPTAGSAF